MQERLAQAKREIVYMGERKSEIQIVGGNAPMMSLPKLEQDFKGPKSPFLSAEKLGKVI